MAIPASNNAKPSNAKPSNAKPSTDSPEVAALRAQLAAAEAARAAAEAKAARFKASGKDPRPAYSGDLEFRSYPVLMTITMDDGREVSFPFGRTDGDNPGDRAGLTTWAAPKGTAKGLANANCTAKAGAEFVAGGHKVQVGCNLTVLRPKDE